MIHAAIARDPARTSLVLRGKRLEYFTIIWNILEGLVAVLAGLLAGSISLVGFGLQSLIEVISGAALLWRMAMDAEESRREQIEAVTLRTVGICFLLLAAYVFYDSIRTLVGHHRPGGSPLGIGITILSLVVMPILTRAKHSVGVRLGSSAMLADAKQTEFCVYLSAITLGGLALNALFRLWWADPVAALIMVPLIGKEGWSAVQGKPCCASL